MVDTKIRNRLLTNFLRISNIPRKSGNEEKIADFFVNVAKENNLYYYKDKNNNVLIKKKGSINSLPIALQAHLDMVCVKTDDSNHDFLTDGIEVAIDNDKVSAKNTSLGADQGVGLAIMLTIMEEKNIKHPDIEFMFTTEEETTFKGAITFTYSLVESKRIINLDNSKDDTVFVGADGDICNEYSFYGNLIENNLPSYKIKIDNSFGGNSSENINLSRKNAITTMAKILENKDIFIASINGGISENDIATTCEVVINTSIDVEKIFEGFNKEITRINNNKTFSKKDTESIVRQILELKCGFISNDMSSANLGLIKTEEEKVQIYYVFRSMNEMKLEEINKSINSLHNGFNVFLVYRDPIWQVNRESELLKQYRKVYFKEYLTYPKEEIWHGSIECSSIKKRINNLDIISIGSMIEYFHTVNEVTYINSWVKIYNLLIKLIEYIK